MTNPYQASRDAPQPELVARLVEQREPGKAIYGKYLMGILGIQLWDDLFMKGCKPRNQ